jgi:hypothetical protein
MPPSSPVANKKARGLVAQRSKEPLPIETDEFVEEFHAIEKDLKDHLLGSVKVMLQNMTFEWKSGQNREMADENRSANLRENMRNGVFRLDPVHRMSGTIDASTFKKCIQDSKTNKNITMAHAKEMNEKAEFPVFSASANAKIEMQSGQHRMKILKQLRPQEKDHWWIVTVYDESTTLL